MNRIRIGTRDSALALWQASWVKKKLESLHPEKTFELAPMKTKGDKILDVSLAKIGDKGLFTKELEQGLLRLEIDMAVHSLKDVPTLLPDGLEIAAFCAREEARDAFLSKGGVRLKDLPAGAVIGTSSLRRIAQLRYYRPDLVLTDVRGNLQTRWQKLQESGMDGIVLAAAGVRRLGWEERITEVIPEEIVLPAVGQGVIAVEIVAGRGEVAALLKGIHHEATGKIVRAERALMRHLEGGCQIPIGALGTMRGQEICLDGLIASLDGTRILRASACGTVPEDVGREAGQRLLDQGAANILDQIR
ncbi:MAG: hydroxymethylbilane synthase [Peptococcaceae bacterium]|jgi:hydroxymethylbilane synthase|nr:hydroxymethylbilane synthase [Peptococcaceae bacterium]